MPLSVKSRMAAAPLFGMTPEFSKRESFAVSLILKRPIAPSCCPPCVIMPSRDQRRAGGGVELDRRKPGVEHRVAGERD